MRVGRRENERTGELALRLTVRALEGLKSCSTMLEVAAKLLKQGNSKEADRLRYEARMKRKESMLLIAQANGMSRPGHFAH